MTVEPDGHRLRIGQPEAVVRLSGGALSEFGIHPDGRILVSRRRGGTERRSVGVVVGWDRESRPAA